MEIYSFTVDSIGLVLNNLNRTIYVDGVAVAEETSCSLGGSQMGLYIGTRKAMEPGIYISGLMDDIRIYNQALSAEVIAALVK